jgi:hypothetical protein
MNIIILYILIYIYYFIYITQKKCWFHCSPKCNNHHLNIWRCPKMVPMGIIRQKSPSTTLLAT